MEEDEAIRAQFPLSFGKKTKSQSHSIVAAHAATRRQPTSPTSSSLLPAPNTTVKSNIRQVGLFPYRKKSDSKGGNEQTTSSVEEEEVSQDDSGLIGPPRPPLTLNDDEVMVGPPRPPMNDDDEDEDVPIIGPPRPPMVESDVDEDEDDGSMMPDDLFRIPMTNEIVLKGHSKVINLLAFFIICCNLAEMDTKSPFFGSFLYVLFGSLIFVRKVEKSMSD